MTTTQKNRLQKLAQHLLTGVLAHEKFDFSVVNTGQIDATGCGTSGCAMGELPLVFPEHWQFQSTEYPSLPKLKGRSYHYLETAVREFFGLSQSELVGLFYPNLDIAPWNKRLLLASAKRRQVAYAILRFLKWKEKQPTPAPTTSESRL